jgi:hypothetical protein
MPIARRHPPNVKNESTLDKVKPLGHYPACFGETLDVILACKNKLSPIWSSVWQLVAMIDEPLARRDGKSREGENDFDIPWNRIQGKRRSKERLLRAGRSWKKAVDASTDRSTARWRELFETHEVQFHTSQERDGDWSLWMRVYPKTDLSKIHEVVRKSLA